MINGVGWNHQPVEFFEMDDLFGTFVVDSTSKPIKIY
jgi:hypothetical protein